MYSLEDGGPDASTLGDEPKECATPDSLGDWATILVASGTGDGRATLTTVGMQDKVL